MSHLEYRLVALCDRLLLISLLLVWNAVNITKLLRANAHILEKTASLQRGILASWGSIRKYQGVSSVCDIIMKEANEKQIISMILRYGLPMGFAENVHFQNLVELLCPAYAKSSNAYPGAYVSIAYCRICVFPWLYWQKERKKEISYKEGHVNAIKTSCVVYTYP